MTSAPTLRTTPTRHSKRVRDRIKIAGTLRGVVEAFREKVEKGFELRFAARLEGGQASPDPTPTLDLVVQEVMEACDELVASDNAYCGAGTRRQILQKAADAVALSEVFPELRDERAHLDTVFGRVEARRLHGLKGDTPRKPRQLLEHTGHLVRALGSGQELPPPRRPGQVFDREGCLERLTPGYRKLKEMLWELDELEVVEARRREDRDYELESFDVVYHDALAYVSSVFRLAGLSDKVLWHLRPYSSRSELRSKARGEGEARAEGRRSQEAGAEGS